MLNSSKLPACMFIFFIIPGLPKDLLIFLAALTSMRPLLFFTLLLLGRLPWLIASVSVGSSLHQEDYGIAIAITVISVIAFVVGYRYKDALVNQLARLEKRKQKL
nr:hypothetical protein [Paenibacillus xylanexedens]